VAVQNVTKDLIRSKITYRSLAFAEKTSLKDEEKQSDPSLSPPSSQRAATPPSCEEAGTKPLASTQP
jgi:hypothetical protein